MPNFKLPLGTSSACRGWLSTQTFRRAHRLIILLRLCQDFCNSTLQVQITWWWHFQDYWWWKRTVCPVPLQATSAPSISSQNHKLSWVGRDPQRLSSPTAASAQTSQESFSVPEIVVLTLLDLWQSWVVTIPWGVSLWVLNTKTTNLVSQTVAWQFSVN